MALLLFLLPGDPQPDGTRPRIIDWDQVEKKIPWGVLLLFGAVFAMADAFKELGSLNGWGGLFAEQMQGAPTWVLLSGPAPC